MSVHILEMADYLQYVKHLGFNENPDYNRLRNIFKKSMEKNRFEDDKNFDWIEKKKLVRFCL